MVRLSLRWPSARVAGSGFGAGTVVLPASDGVLPLRGTLAPGTRGIDRLDLLEARRRETGRVGGMGAEDPAELFEEADRELPGTVRTRRVERRDQCAEAQGRLGQRAEIGRDDEEPGGQRLHHRD